MDEVWPRIVAQSANRSDGGRGAPDQGRSLSCKDNPLINLSTCGDSEKEVCPKAGRDGLQNVSY